ncbi:MAG TPA: hypothetical protein VLM89_17260 [Phycisphaerae bacterium]|nr:hypothetical protein [Phycisphaerae bacterium]
MFRMHGQRVGIVGGVLLMVLAWPSLLWAQAPASAPATATAPVLPPDPMVILKAIPGDATGFLVVRNLKELNGDLMGLAGSLGLPLGANGLFPAPLDWVKEMAGLAEGIDDNGSLGVALLNCADAKSNDEVTSKVVLFIPTNNVEALLTALGGQKDQDIYAVNLGGQALVAAPMGRFLAVSQSSETLRAVAKAQGEGEGIAKTMSPNRVEAYQAQDVFGWADLRGFSKDLRDGVSNTLLGMMAMANMAEMNMQDQTAVKQGEDAVRKLEKFIDESRELSLGLALDRRGVSLSFFFRMDPESSLGKEMKATKAVDGTLLAGLPDEPTVLVLGTVVGQTEQSGLPDWVDAVLSSGGVSEHLTPEQSAALKEGMLKVFGDIEMANLSLANLPAEARLGLFSVVAVARVKDSGQYIEQSHKLFDVVKGIVATAAGKTAEGQAPQEGQADPVKAAADAIQWKTKAEEVAGVPVDHLVVDLAAIPDAGEEDVQKIKGVVGPEGILIRVAAVDKQHVVLAFGGGAERMAKVIELVKRGDSPLAKGGVQTISKRLPAGPRLMEGYVHVDQVLKLVTTVVTQLGEPMPVPLVMRNPGPIAFCVNRVEDTAQEFHLVLPTELMLSVKEAIAPLLQMFMGGGPEGMDMEMPPPTPESGVQ